MGFHLDIQLMAVAGALAVRFAVLAATLPLLELRSVPPLWRFGLAACFAGALAPGIAAGLPAGTLDLSWSSLVLEALRRTGFVQKDACGVLGVSRRKLNYMIQRMGITHPSWRRNR